MLAAAWLALPCPWLAGIMKTLKDAGRMHSQSQFFHSYPHCWRSDTPLIYKARPTAPRPGPPSRNQTPVLESPPPCLVHTKPASRSRPPPLLSKNNNNKTDGLRGALLSGVSLPAHCSRCSHSNDNNNHVACGPLCARTRTRHHHTQRIPGVLILVESCNTKENFQSNST